MTDKTPPDYGVRTCGKLAEPPFDILGPCLLDPDHDGRCRFRAPGTPDGTISVSKMEPGESPFENDPIIVKYRRYIQRMARITTVMFAICAVATVYSVLNALDII